MRVVGMCQVATVDQACLSGLGNAARYNGWHGLYAGREEDRDAIASIAGQYIKAHLDHEGEDVRTAALWVILNLTDG